MTDSIYSPYNRTVWLTFYNTDLEPVLKLKCLSTLRPIQYYEGGALIDVKLINTEQHAILDSLYDQNCRYAVFKLDANKYSGFIFGHWCNRSRTESFLRLETARVD